MNQNAEAIELSTDGTDWFIMANVVSGGSGVTTVASFSGSSQTNGASISGVNITFGPADNTNPGMVTTGADTWYGVKTFNSVPVASGLTTPAATAMTLTSAVANSGTNIGIELNNSTTLSGTTKLLSVQNNGSEVFSILNDGTIATANATASINNLLPSQGGVTSGWVLSTNGTNTAWAAPGAGGGATVGNATVQFGAAPGSNLTSVNVTTSGLVSGSTIWCFMQADTTADHTATEHILADIKLVGQYVNSTTFTIWAISPDRLTGQFEVRWAWQ